MTYSLDRLRRCSVAIDLGSSRTRIHAKQHGLLVDEPSVVAVNVRTGALMAVGTAAARMDGRTPDHIRVVRPVCNGTVIDIDMAQRMLRALISGGIRRSWQRRGVMNRAAVTVPYGADPLARRAAIETLTGVGARKVELVDTPTAAGLGCGLPVEQPEATMVLVCGATTTQVAVLSLGTIVSGTTVPMGGETIRHALTQHLRNAHELMLAQQTAQPLHLALTVSDSAAGGPIDVHGRDVTTGFARGVAIDPAEVRAAVQPALNALTDAVRTVLRACPPDLVADLADSGMTLVGGSALLPGLDERLRVNTGMAVHVADQPALSAVRGLAAIIEGRAEPYRAQAAEPSAA